ncbi:MAG: DoxX family protein [Shimia sp.]
MPRILVTAAALILAALFVYFGLRKVTSDPRDVAIYVDLGFGQWPRYVTGTVELVGAALIAWPGTRVWGGLLLAATMVAGLSGLVLFTERAFWHLVVLGVAAGGVAWGARRVTG